MFNLSYIDAVIMSCLTLLIEVSVVCFMKIYFGSGLSTFIVRKQIK